MIWEDLTTKTFIFGHDLKCRSPFALEIMRTNTRDERTFRVQNVLSNGRVTLHNFEGEFRETAFEPMNFLREKVK